MAIYCSINILAIYCQQFFNIDIDIDIAIFENPILILILILAISIYCCNILLSNILICIPESGKTRSKEAGASVEVFGDYWDMADKEARSRITDDSGKKMNFQKNIWMSFPGLANFIGKLTETKN